MNKEGFIKKNKSERVLIAPLDWGLGHATRCIPIIYELLVQNCTVIIAADGPTEILLKTEFPHLSFLKLNGYAIQYSQRKSWFSVKIFLQLPKIIKAIYYEHSWLKKAVKENNIDIVIADNRFGLYHAAVPCIYITHQLVIKTGNRFTEKIAQHIHYYFIKKYTQCWVPDFKDDDNLAGELSHPKKNIVTAKYIGALSRFEKKPDVEKKYDLLLLLSGPEPQRSIFEKLLRNELRTFLGSILLVRGLPGNDSNDIYQQNIIVKNHLNANELGTAIQQSNLVIGRSGYTTIMDLVKLQQKAVLVATPGQTEQEYLAQHLAKQKIFHSIEQDKFILNEVLQEVEKLAFIIPQIAMQQYKKVIEEFIQSNDHTNLG
jgi:uncharacterized protein (TIGR00661 family)